MAWSDLRPLSSLNGKRVCTRIVMRTRFVFIPMYRFPHHPPFDCDRVFFMVGAQCSYFPPRSAPTKTCADQRETLSGDAPPSGPESDKCQAYKVQLLRGRYRLLVHSPRPNMTTNEMAIIDCDRIARVVGGVEVSVFRPNVTMRPIHHQLYASHVKHFYVFVWLMSGARFS